MQITNKISTLLHNKRTNVEYMIRRNEFQNIEFEIFLQLCRRKTDETETKKLLFITIKINNLKIPHPVYFQVYGKAQLPRNQLTIEHFFGECCSLWTLRLSQNGNFVIHITSWHQEMSWSTLTVFPCLACQVSCNRCFDFWDLGIAQTDDLVLCDLLMLKLLRADQSKSLYCSISRYLTIYCSAFRTRRSQFLESAPRSFFFLDSVHLGFQNKNVCGIQRGRTAHQRNVKIWWIHQKKKS